MYEQNVESLQEKVKELLSTIDIVHEENIELARELTQIYDEIADEKDILEENMT